MIGRKIQDIQNSRLVTLMSRKEVVVKDLAGINISVKEFSSFDEVRADLYTVAKRLTNFIRLHGYALFFSFFFYFISCSSDE